MRSSLHSNDDLSDYLQRSLTRRLNIFKRRCAISTESLEVDHDSFAASSPLEFDIEDAELTRHHITPTKVHTVEVPSWLIPSTDESASLLLSLASIHPSREFANSHLEQRASSTLRNELQSTRWWFEKREWKIRNYSTNNDTIEFVEVRIACRDEDDADGRINFSLILFQSVTFPNELTLHHSIIPDEQSSQISFHTAEAEQKELMKLQADSSSLSDNVRSVDETAHLRFTSMTLAYDEVRLRTSRSSSSNSSSNQFEPITPLLLPTIGQILHRFGLPLTIDTIKFFAVVSGFDALNQDILPAINGIISSLQSAGDVARIENNLHELIRSILWPNEPIDSSLLALSTHARTIEQLPIVIIGDMESNTNDDHAYDNDASFVARFSSLNMDSSSTVGDTPLADDALASNVNAATFGAPNSSTSALLPYRHLPGLITSYCHPIDWSIEFELFSLRRSVSSSSSASAKKKAPTKPAKSKSKRR